MDVYTWVKQQRQRCLPGVSNKGINVGLYLERVAYTNLKEAIMNKRRTLRTSVIRKYVQHKLKRTLLKDESLIDVCISCLVEDGATLPDKDYNKRSFIEKHKDIVLCVPKKKIDNFLQSFEWRKLRMVALKKYGPRCQCCGATPATGAIMNVDHIKPRKLFPELSLDIDNLQILCHECNHGKGNWDTTDWR